MRIRWVAMALLAAGAHACVSLQELDLDVCGNGVIDQGRGERCDTYHEYAGSHCALPGEPNECRYVCQDALGTVYQCPPGWGCGADHVCRAHAGAFTAAEPLAIAGGDWSTLVDVDGDGRADVVTQRAAQLSVDFLTDGAAAGGYDMPLYILGQPAVADLDADGRMDVIVPTALGLVVMEGTEARTASPLSYATIRRPDQPFAFVDVDLIPDVVDPVDGAPIAGIGREPLLLTDGPGSLVIHSFLRAEIDHDFGVTALVSPLPVGSFDTALSGVPAGALGLSPQQLVVTHPGDTSLALFRPAYRYDPDAELLELRLLCDGGGNACLDPRPIALVAPAVVEGPAAAVHLNAEIAPGTSGIDCGGVAAMGDAHLDLVVQTDDGIYAAFGLGDGRFHGDPCALADVVAGTLTADDTAAPHPLFAGCPAFLAIDDVDGDALPDVVSETNVHLSAWVADLSVTGVCDVESPTLVPPIGERWIHARLADIDGDGDRDIVLATATPGIDVFRLEDGLPNLTKVATDAVVDATTVGDFDGDGIDDIAFVQPAGADQKDAVAILFGEPFAAPGPARTVASFRGLDVIASSTVDDALVTFPDATSDLLVSVGEGGEAHAAILHGRSDRLVHAAFSPQYDLLSLARFTPFAVAVAGADPAADPGPLHIVSFGLETHLDRSYGPLGMSRIDIAGDAELSLYGSGARTTGILDSGDFQATTLVPLHATIEAPLPLVALLEPRYGNGTSSRRTAISVLQLADDDDGFSEPLATAELEGVTLAGRDNGIAFDVPLLERWGPRLSVQPLSCRLSGDERTLVLMLMRGVSCGSDPADAAPELWAIPVAALTGGAIDLSQLERAPVPEGETPISFTCANIDGDPDEEIVLATLAPALPSCADAPPADWQPTLNLHLLEAGSDVPVPIRQIGADLAPSLSVSAAGPPATSVAVGDIDGDGVNDVILGTRSSSVLLRGEAAP